VRFNNLSPVSYALAKADAEGLPWVVVLHGDRLRLYPTAVGIGVGRRGRTETYVEVQTSLLTDEHLPYLWLLFSAEGLDAKGAVTELLDAAWDEEEAQLISDSLKYGGDRALDAAAIYWGETYLNLPVLSPQELLAQAKTMQIAD
jgi:hypothetical protein